MWNDWYPSFEANVIPFIFFSVNVRNSNLYDSKVVAAKFIFVMKTTEGTFYTFTDLVWQLESFTFFVFLLFPLYILHWYENVIVKKSSLEKEFIIW